MKRIAVVVLSFGLVLGFGRMVAGAEEKATVLLAEDPQKMLESKPDPESEPAQEAEPDQEVEPVPEAEQEPELEYAFGTVKSVGNGEIVVSELDYDSGQGKDEVYAVDPNVELHNAASLAQIVPGDEVDIDYQVEGDKKMAKVIAVAKPLPGGVE